MWSSQRISRSLSRYMTSLVIVVLALGCGSYIDPPKDFKDSYIVTEVSGMGELGTIAEFESGLAKLVLDNGKTPEIHGWKKNDNVYTLCFTMKDQAMEAVFTHILGGMGIDPAKQGKTCTIDYVSDGKSELRGVNATSIILMAVGALQESGVETTIQKTERERKRQAEENIAKQKAKLEEDHRKYQEEKKIEDELDSFIDSFSLPSRRESAGDEAIPDKFIDQIYRLRKDRKIKNKSEVEAFLRQNALKIADAQQTEKFLKDEFESSGEQLYSETWQMFRGDKFNSIAEAKAFLKANGRDSDKIREKRKLDQYRISVSTYIGSNDLLSEFDKKIQSNEICTVEQAKTYLTAQGININKYELLSVLSRQRSDTDFPYELFVKTREMIQSEKIKTKEDLRKSLQDQGFHKFVE